MTTIEIEAPLAPVLNLFSGSTYTEKIAGVLSREIQRYLLECEEGMLALEIRYGMDYTEFQHGLEAGELGDEFQFQLESDAIQWSDLMTEKRHWLSQLRAVSKMQDRPSYERLGIRESSPFCHCQPPARSANPFGGAAGNCPAGTGGCR